jgi:hypothetical protein
MIWELLVIYALGVAMGYATRHTVGLIRAYRREKQQQRIAIQFVKGSKW